MITNLTSTDGASAQIAHHGAQVISWIPANRSEQLFLSKTSPLDSEVAIRGGVPVIFPQFGGFGPLPKHGFARDQIWHCRPSESSNRAVFELRDNTASRAIWLHAFLAELTITLSATTLDIELAIHNTGSTAFEFAAALHTYFRVDHIGDVRITGLKGASYRDSVSGEAVEDSDAISIQGHIDRIYMQAPTHVEVQQTHQRVVIQSQGYTDTVVWNPWEKMGATITDLEPDGYQRMVCVESAVISKPIQLQPGQIWRASQRLAS